MPMVAPLKDSGCEVRLFGKDAALRRYRDEGLHGEDIMAQMSEVNADAVRSFLTTLSPALILSGTSADDMTEKLIWSAANGLGIPCFAIVDQWVNYGIRFSQYSLADMEIYNARKEHPFLPRRIFVTDEQAKREMTRDGIPAERIAVTGNPYFEHITNKAAAVSPNRLEQIRTSLGIRKGDLVVAFASEPILRMYGQNNYLGYTEKTIAEEIIKALMIIQARSGRNITLLLRLHPKDEAGHYDDIKDTYGGKIAIVVDRGMQSYELPLVADVVCGMYSMLLVEAALLKRPFMSVQIGLKRKDPFMLSRTGAVSTVGDRDTLVAELFSILFEGKVPSSAFRPLKTPIKNIMCELGENVCKN